MLSLNEILETNIAISPPKYVKSAPKWYSWIELEESFRMMDDLLHFGEISIL